MTAKYNKLVGKRVLVFGGTSGIGFCTAEASIEAGALVTISGSSQGKLDSALERLRKAYPEAEREGRIAGYKCDLRIPVESGQEAETEAFEKQLGEVLKKAAGGEGGKLNHIAWTAGDGLTIPKLSETNISELVSGMRVRFLAPITLVKLLPKYMDLSPLNSLTLTGGVNTDKPMPTWGIVASIGAAIEGLMRGLAVDLKPLRVNVVAPGAVLTELWDSIGEERRRMATERAEQGLLVGKIGKPEDTAEAYLYLMKDEFMTGQVIKTSGGALLS